jgi:hypothetical protein
MRDRLRGNSMFHWNGARDRASQCSLTMSHYHIQLPYLHCPPCPLELALLPQLLVACFPDLATIPMLAQPTL